MRVLTLGGAMIDTLAIISSDRIERMAMSNADSSYLLLEEGTKIEAQEVSTHCGGGGINAAVAMARLGLDVATLVKLGRDQRAETLLTSLMAEGVSTRWVVRDGRAPTGASVLISSHDRNAGVFTFRGANTLLELADLREEAFGVDVVYISNLSNKSAEMFPHIVEAAKRNRALVAVNPGLRQLSAYWPTVEALLPKIDVLAINRTEAAAILPHLVARFGEDGPRLAGDDLPSLAARGLRGGGFEMSLAGFLAAMAKLGLGRLVLTDGDRGAYVSDGKEVVFCPAAKCETVGTAGAGDAFASTFTAALAHGWSIDDGLKAATLNAASVIGYVDTQSGLLAHDALRARMRETELEIRRWPLEG